MLLVQLNCLNCRGLQFLPNPRLPQQHHLWQQPSFSARQVIDSNLKIAKIRVDGTVVYSLETESEPEIQALSAEEELPMLPEETQEEQQTENEEETIAEESADEKLLDWLFLLQTQLQ